MKNKQERVETFSQLKKYNECSPKVVRLNPLGECISDHVLYCDE